MSDVVKARVMRGRLEWTVSAGAGGVGVARIVRVNNAMRWRCDGVSVRVAVQPVLFSGQDDWRERAACRGMDTEMFYAERGATKFDAAQIKALCAECPVSEECLDFALKVGEQFGVWGGLSVKERRRVRRLKARAETDTYRHSSTQTLVRIGG